MYEESLGACTKRGHNVRYLVKDGWGILFLRCFVHPIIVTSEAFQLLHTQIWRRFLRSFVSLILRTGLLHGDTTYSYTPVDTK